MPIVAQCGCGKTMTVDAAMAGRTAFCPRCSSPVQVPSGRTAPSSRSSAPAKAGTPAGRAKAPAAAGRRAAAAVPAVTVSPALVIGAGVAVAVLAVALAIYFGPWRVGTEWAAMSPKANTDVTDVVMFALQAHQSQSLAGLGGGGGGGISMSKAPAIEGGANFIPPAMAFTLPRRMVFTGATSQGGYKGTYDTTTGEVVADVEVGGYTVGGLVAMRRATDQIHVTGRETDGRVTAEEDGSPMTIIVPAYHGRPSGY